IQPAQHAARLTNECMIQIRPQLWATRSSRVFWMTLRMMPRAMSASSRFMHPLLLILLQPGRDLVAELRLEDASDMVSILDLDERPVLAHRSKRLDIKSLDEIVFLSDD